MSYIRESWFPHIEQRRVFQAMSVFCLYTRPSLSFVNKAQLVHRRQTSVRDYVSPIRRLFVNKVKSPDFLFNRLYYKQGKRYHNLRFLHLLCYISFSWKINSKDEFCTPCAMFHIHISWFKKLNSAFKFYIYRKPVPM
jgi:hypothetical protein